MTSDDRLRYFRPEARELVDGLFGDLAELSRSDDRVAVTATMLRRAHTLKGAARVVERPEIADAAHDLEGEISGLRDGDGDVARVMAGLERLDRLVAELTRPSVPDGALTGERDDTDPAPAELLAGTSQLGVVDRLLDHLDEAVQQLDSPDDVDVVRRHLREACDAAELLRLTPVSAIAGELQRVVEDAAIHARRRVTVSVRGRAERVDAHVLAQLRPALVQLLRNAVVHGVEPPDERIALGKSEVGRIDVAFEWTASRLRVVVEDDGAGVDVQEVRRHLGRRPGNDPGALTDEQVLESLFRGAGVTTADEVSVLAGRGVGLDVVLESVAAMGGTVTPSTRRGRGTRVEITLPKVTAARPVLTVVSGGEQFAFPLASVRSLVRLAPDQLVPTADGVSVMVDGIGSVAARPLRFGPDDEAMQMSEQPVTAVVLDRSDGPLAVLVDRLRGIREIIARPAPSVLGRDSAVVAVYRGELGRVEFMLDPERIAVVGAPPRTPIPPDPILIIDDSLTTRMLEQSILEAAGYRTDLAVSAEDALERLADQRYSLFVVDVEMPGMSGFEFVEFIRRDQQLAAVPCLLLSSRSSSEDVQRGIHVGAAGYITKGEFDQTVFLRTVRELVSP